MPALSTRWKAFLGFFVLMPLSIICGLLVFWQILLGISRIPAAAAPTAMPAPTATMAPTATPAPTHCGVRGYPGIPSGVVKVLIGDTWKGVSDGTEYEYECTLTGVTQRQTGSIQPTAAPRKNCRVSSYIIQADTTQPINGVTYFCDGDTGQALLQQIAPTAMPTVAGPRGCTDRRFTIAHGNPWVIDGNPVECVDGDWQPLTSAPAAPTAAAIAQHQQLIGAANCEWAFFNPAWRVLGQADVGQPYTPPGSTIHWLCVDAPKRWIDPVAPTTP